MAEAENITPPIENRNWLGQPYAERRVLAGFLNPGEVELVYPQSSEWSDDVSGQVAALYGAANSLPPRTESGICNISSIEEPDALTVLDPIGKGIPAPLVASFSYSWVNIQNLIAVSAVADPFPPPVSLANNNAGALAEYSLYEPIGQPVFVGLALATTGPVNLVPLQAAVKNGQLVVRYQLSKVVKPIIVGYEQGRCYLLKEYGRVLAAMAQGVNRLLCLVYYGLDLTQVDLKVRGLHVQGLVGLGEQINHFGSERLSGANVPLVGDFLDSQLTAAVPSRAPLFIWQPTVQPLGIQLEIAAQGPLPLTGSLLPQVSVPTNQ
jgi:hypothetical protein